MCIRDRREGDDADFILVEDLENFKVKATYINGEKIAEDGKSFIQSVESKIVNNFFTEKKYPRDFEIQAESNQIQVIKAIDGEIVTESFISKTKIENSLAVSDLENDILKMTVVNRYQSVAPVMAFINNSI